ncbi:hypothetical protein [Escherichia coli]
MAEYLQSFFVGGLEGLYFSLGRGSYAHRVSGGRYFNSERRGYWPLQAKAFFFLFTELQRTNNFPARNEAGDVREEVRIYCSFEFLHLQYCFLSRLQIFVENRIARGKTSPFSGLNDELIRAERRKQRKLASYGQHKKPRRAEIIFLFQN